jgi:hypothetical protein
MVCRSKTVRGDLGAYQGHGWGPIAAVMASYAVDFSEPLEKPPTRRAGGYGEADYVTMRRCSRASSA